MEYWHYNTIKRKILDDLDLHDESFITDDELLGYINEAIDYVESNIHALYEDYFLTSGKISLISGVDEYALPEDIFAIKIRKIFYDNGSTKYEVRRIKRLTDTMFFTDNDKYKYLILNKASGYRIKIFPTPRENIDLTIYYIRNARKLTKSEAEDNVCDIPEFINVVIQMVKVRCYEKEGNPNLQIAIALANDLKNLMMETLRNMVADEDTKLELDTQFYYDFDRGV